MSDPIQRACDVFSGLILDMPTCDRCGEPEAFDNAREFKPHDTKETDDDKLRMYVMVTCAFCSYDQEIILEIGRNPEAEP